MNQQPDIADDNDIILFESNTYRPVGYSTARAVEVIEAIANKLNGTSRWSSDGVECQYLRPNSSWKKGKIRIRIEFLEPEPEEIEEANQEDE